MQNFIIKITQENDKMLQHKEIGCFILGTDLSGEFIKQFISIARQNGQLCLILGENSADVYKEYGADGVVLDLSKNANPKKEIKEFKKSNKNALLGVVSRNRRHESMLISEEEPDFIIFKFWKDGFEENLSLLEWYNEFFLIQNAVLPVEDVDLQKIKSDFLILDDMQYNIFVAK